VLNFVFDDHNSIELHEIKSVIQGRLSS